MSDVKQFKRGLVLTPVSSDPSSPIQGQYQESDGTARSAGLWRYDGTSWVEAGGSGGGGLDTFHTETFENNGASTFTQGNDADPDAAGTGTIIGTLSDDTSTQISGLQSLKYVQGATSINDFFIVDTDISVDVKQVANDAGVSFYYKYDGDDGDIKFVALDQDDVVLSSSLDLLDAATTATRFTTSFYIPTGTTAIRYGFQTVVTNDTQILIVDDIELSLNPFVYKNLVETQTSKAVSQANFWDAAGVGVNDFDISLVSNSSNSNHIIEDSGGLTRIRAIRDIDISVTVQINVGGGDGVWIKDSAAGIISIQENGTGANDISTSARVYLLAGDYIYAEGNVNGRTAGIIITSTATTEHVVTPAKSNMTDWIAYTPTSTNGGFGTFASSNAHYRLNGPNVEIKGTFTAGTVVGATEAQLDLPNGYTVLSEITPTTLSGQWGNNTSNIGATLAVIITGDDAFVNIALQDTNISLTPTTIGAVSNSSDVHGFSASVPVNELTSDVTFLAAIPVQKVAYLKDVQTSGTHGGTFTAGAWRTRILNFSDGDTSIVSLDTGTSRFTLGAGTYKIEGSAPSMKVGSNKTKIYNITDSTDDILGTSCFSDNTGVGSLNANCKGTITITSAKVFELQHYCGTTAATWGLGYATSASVSEIYGTVTITKLR